MSDMSCICERVKRKRVEDNNKQKKNRCHQIRLDSKSILTEKFLDFLFIYRDNQSQSNSPFRFSGDFGRLELQFYDLLR